MKSYKLLSVSAGFAAMMFAGSASAQFGIPNLGSLGNLASGVAGVAGNRGASSPATAGVSNGSTQGFMSHFSQAQAEINAGQLLLAAAFGLKDQVALLEAEKIALSSGALDTDGAKKSEELSESVNAEIAKRIDSGAQLNEEGRKQYEAAMPHMANGTLALANMVPDSIIVAQSVSGSMRSGDIFSKISTAAGTGATGYKFFTQFPGFYHNARDAYGKAASYGRANKIPVPDNATNALGSL